MKRGIRAIKEIGNRTPARRLRIFDQRTKGISAKNRLKQCQSMFINPCFINPCFINPCFINPCFIYPRTYRGGGGGGDDKTSASEVFCSGLFIPRANFETGLVMVSYYGYEI